MDRDAAERRCEQLRRDHGEEQLLFLPHELADGEWEVRTVRVGGAGRRSSVRVAETHAPPEVTPAPDEGRVPPSPWLPWQG